MADLNAQLPNALSNPKKRNALIVAAVALVALIAFFSLKGGSADDTLAKFNADSVKAINAKAPMKIDSITTLTSAETKGDDGLQYNYKLSIGKDEIEGDVEKQMKPDIVKQTCANATPRKTLEMGNTLYYRYVDKNDATIGEFNITKGDCQ